MLLNRPLQQQPSAFSAIAKTNGDAGMKQGQQQQSRSRLPPQQQQQQQNPTVEMPGDSLGRLDVQFGGLDLQFGGGGSGSGGQTSSDNNTNGGGSSSAGAAGAYDFNGQSAAAATPVTAAQQPESTADATSNKYLDKPKEGKDYIGGGAPPTAKEVTKSLSSAVIPGQTASAAAAAGNKLNDGYGSQVE